MAIAPGYNFYNPLHLGALRAVTRDPLSFQLQARERFGDIVRIRIGPLVSHFLYHPDHVYRVLVERQKNYLRGWQYRLLQRVFGDNLVAAEGPYWMRQRRLAQPSFHRQRLASYCDSMVRATEELLKCWHSKAKAGDAVDVGPEISQLAYSIAGRTLLNLDVGNEADAIRTSFVTVAEYLDYRFKNPITALPLSLPSPGNIRFKRAKQTLEDTMTAIIQRRRREGIDQGDLLSMLIQARDEETGEQMTDRQLRTEALTFLIAGHETTARSLLWTIYLLATRPEFRERLRQEAATVFSGRLPTIDAAAQLDDCRLVIEESLRLYPSVWLIARQAAAEDEIGGFRIPARSDVVLSQFVTHRHPDIWEDPEAFDPDRFTAARSADRPKGAYFPFLLGPHQCIGNEFAMLEMQIIIAMVLQRFDFSLLIDQPIEPRASLTLYPSAPVRIKLRGLAG